MLQWSWLHKSLWLIASTLPSLWYSCMWYCCSCICWGYIYAACMCCCWCCMTCCNTSCTWSCSMRCCCCCNCWGCWCKCYCCCTWCCWCILFWCCGVVEFVVASCIIFASYVVAVWGEVVVACVVVASCTWSCSMRCCCCCNCWGCWCKCDCCCTWCCWCILFWCCGVVDTVVASCVIFASCVVAVWGEIVVACVVCCCICCWCCMYQTIMVAFACAAACCLFCCFTCYCISSCHHVCSWPLQLLLMLFLNPLLILGCVKQNVQHSSGLQLHVWHQVGHCIAGIARLSSHIAPALTLWSRTAIIHCALSCPALVFFSSQTSRTSQTCQGNIMLTWCMSLQDGHIKSWMCYLQVASNWHGISLT